MRLLKNVLLILAAPLLFGSGVGCKMKADSSSESSQSGGETGGGSSAGVPLKPADFQRAYRRASVIFLRSSPSLDQLQSVVDRDSYNQAIRELVDNPAFVSTMRTYHQAFFEMSGMEDDINYDEPANLAAYLIRENMDFRDILRATYCVNNDLERIDCSSFEGNTQMQDTYAAGVITTQAFLRNWESSFNFVRTRETLKAFGCEEYPDSTDAGMTRREVETGVHTWECTNCVPSCYSCHSTMNARATLFYDFDINGVFDLDPPNRTRTLNDEGGPSQRTDLLIEGAAPRFNGQVMNNLRDYALALSDTPKFTQCLARRLTLYSIGGDLEASLPESMSFVTQMMRDNGFQVREFYYNLLKRDEYVRH